GMVENIVLVEDTAESNDNVFAADTLWKDTSKLDSCNWRNLPPSLTGSPDRGSISTDNRCAETADSTVHVGVRVGGYGESSRPSITLLDKNLMSNSSSGRVEINAMCVCKLLN